MRRGLLLLACFGLFTTLSGCRHSSQSSCGCQSEPSVGHLSPAPIGGAGVSGGSLYSGPAGNALAPTPGR